MATCCAEPRWDKGGAGCENRAMTAITTLTLTRPDDWHLHVRDGTPLATVVPHTAAQFGRAIIIPNLKPPCRKAWPSSR